MVPPLVSTRRNDIKMEESESGEEPVAGMVISVILAMISLVIISSFLMVFAIYADSFLFVFATAILQFGFGVDSSASICESAILLCLACYVTTKFIIRSGCKKLRIHSKLYLFNTIVVLGAYCVVVVLNFIYRITKIEHKQCIIGMERYAMIPLIVYDLLVNLSANSGKQKTEAGGHADPYWLHLHTHQQRRQPISAHGFEWRTWMVLFSAIVIQWVTSRDSIASNNNIDSQTMSQQRHSNHGEDVYGLRRSRQQANGVMLEQKNNSSAKRASINSSSLSPRPTPSTKPIADDIGEIALDSTDPMELNDTLSSNNANNPFNEDNLKRSATDDSDEIRMISLSPRKRGTSDSISPLVPTTQISPTEVRIDVDYGSSLTQASEAEGVKLGNCVVIATGGRSDGWRRGRSSSRRYEDSSDP
ncbi:hypothetical protein GE21DRAFT_3300 [Neurospora crassa]|uniref:Uncharacterized protein n=1 Tax=Neurospora crassa (strain ATCC 24698 / 74-OR23-1A / CBS 708.71 / DSM 1257 / FGSC 987) TaxID=367110 RepID=Q7RWJ0_NEUCR|nr:hypothetical protein NCU01717 [Neurospora crassa OR74A]EAA26795.3 hypothetical protein NCU01717 [Neurospora crassa OR74A]KHE83533.1 hypothetical protein GE21DRAFT_3300 [Neurospora crassa]|eukprot:XP_956031.3 hypothetical protein NCU01717 [Neurospora crassa OR74A]